MAMLAEEGSQPKLVASNYMNFGFLFESHFLFRGFPVSHFSRAAAKHWQGKAGVVDSADGAWRLVKAEFWALSSVEFVSGRTK